MANPETVLEFMALKDAQLTLIGIYSWMLLLLGCVLIYQFPKIHDERAADNYRNDNPENFS
jgi:hypothetical protein